MDGHDVLTYNCLNLNSDFFSEEVTITPYTYGAFDPGPYNQSMSAFEDYLGKPYLSDSDGELHVDFFDNPSPIDGKAPAWQIITVYSYEPDFGMDRELILSPMQKLMGSSTSWRHEEYRILFRFGEVTKRFLHFDRMSQLAMSKNDKYWALRFAARAIHYLEDNGTPYHTSPGTLSEILKIPLFYGSQFKKISSYHKFHDRYFGYRLWREYAPFVRAVREVEAGDFNGLTDMVKTTRKRALRILPEIERPIKRLIHEGSSSHSRVDFSRDYFEELVAVEDTRQIDKASCIVLKNIASAVKYYLEHLERRFA
ncbi:MAG: hypothetical protein ACP5FY_10340 [Kosmotogaceae bacterium]